MIMRKTIEMLVVLLLITLPFSKLSAQDAGVNVKGKVVDSKGEPLPLVNVFVKGTTIGVLTDDNGGYSIKIPNNNSTTTLVYSSVGYEQQEALVGNRTIIDISLKSDMISLNEVVVVGFGTQKKVNLTGAVEQVSNEVLENRAVTNIAKGLQGAVPNLNINILDGKPTQSPSFNIRGVTSIGQQGSALILIDGVEGDPSLLNPNDVANISILKDAASASIYGSRGAFGVILITTKNPEKGRTSISYAGNVSIRTPTTTPDNVNDGYTWAKHFSDAYNAWNDYANFPTKINKTMPFSPEYLEELRIRSLDPSLPRVEVDPNTKEYIYYGSTDWYEELYKKATMGTEQNLNISGASDKVTYLLSGRYYYQEGLFRYNSDNFTSMNLRAKGSVKVYEWMTVTNNLNYGNSKYHNPINVGEGGSIWRNIADEGHPVAMMFNPDGTLTHSAAYTVGDFWYGKNGRNTNKDELKNITSLNLSFFNKKLSVNGDFAFSISDIDESEIRVEVPYSRTQNVIAYTGSNTNDIKNLERKNNYLASNLYTQYEDTFGKHYIKPLIGFNYEQSSTKGFSARRNGLVYGDASDLNLALGQAYEVYGGASRWKVAGLFARFNYVFDNRYLLELNGRYDGSSKFPTDQQWAFFPSVSAGWRVSQEKFWTVSPRLINDLKVRASYGSLGNGNISPYAFNEKFTISQSSQILEGVIPSKTTQPNIVPAGLTWETSTTANLGIDLNMFSNRLTINFDIFQRKTTNMFTKGVTLPGIYGASTPFGNYADLDTKGWEIAIGWKDQFQLGKSPFSYNIMLGIADSKSVITRYNNQQKNLSDYYVGMVVGEIWGYETLGFFQSEEEILNSPSQINIPASNGKKLLPGDIKFADLDKDNTISNGANTVDNPGDMRIIGNSSPRYTFTFSVGAEWKGFFVNSLFHGVLKQDWYPSRESRFWGLYNRPYNDLPAWHINNMWTEDNRNAYLPRLRGYVAQGEQRELSVPQTKYMQNVAKVHLQNLQIGYTLPKQIIEKVGMQQVKVFFSGENIWTWTPLYKHTKDTDVNNIYGSDRDLTTGTSGDGYNYPSLRTYTFGVSVTF